MRDPLRMSDRNEAIGFAGVAVMTAVVALTLGEWLFLGITAVTVWRSGTALRRHRASTARAVPPPPSSPAGG